MGSRVGMSVKVVVMVGEGVLVPVVEKVGVMVAGLEVPHTHIHLIPMDAIPDLSFANAKAADNDELVELLAKIKGEL